ncbi:MAG: multidrug effflux MFS transporter [Alphaproteobacteria bacterium]
MLPEKPAMRRPTLLMLIAISAVAPVAMNIILPSLPALQEVFNADYATIQLVLTSFLVAMALGQIVTGSISDAVGRRPVLIGGLCLYVFGTVLCASAWTIEVLVVGRFLQAMGGIAGMVLARAIVRDIYGREKSASFIGYVTMSMVLAPTFSPALGGVLHDLYGWQSIFILSALFGAAVLIYVVAKLPETHLEGRVAPRPGALLRSFASLLRVREFIGYTLVMAFSAGMYFSFIAGAPYVVVNLMGLSAGVYGTYFIAIGMVYMIGNFLSGRLAVRLGPNRMIFMGAIAAIVASLMMIAQALWAPLTPVFLFAPVMIGALANGLTLPSAMAGAISVRPDLAGAASGLSGFIQVGFGACVSYLVGRTLTTTQYPLAMVFVMCGFASVLAFALLVPRRSARPEAVALATAARK